MTSDFLDTLDAAVDSRCACMCGRQITDSSPSAYFASELCARRWRAPASLGVVLDQVASELFTAACGVVRGVRVSFQPIFDEARRLAATFETSDPCPADQAGRALWLRRHRNTGPRPLLRAPTRVDPGSGLCGPLGNGPYRRVR